MSIYDGQCDFGSAIPGRRCPNLATEWPGRGYDSAHCDRHALSFGGPIAPRTWPDIVVEYEAGQAKVESVIAEAERTGFLVANDDNWDTRYYTPRAARETIKRGYSMVKVSLANPISVIENYERKAREAADEAKELRGKAARLRRAARRVEREVNRQ